MRLRAIRDEMIARRVRFRQWKSGGKNYPQVTPISSFLCYTPITKPNNRSSYDEREVHASHDCLDPRGHWRTQLGPCRHREL